MGHNLAERAEQAQGELTQQPLTLAKQIEQMQSQFQLAMPRGLEAVQLVRDAQTCLRTIRNLGKCEPTSVLGALMTCAQLGLRPGVAGLGHAWPLPFWDNRDKCYKAQLVIGYQGYVTLAYRSDRVLSIASRTVFEKDAFSLRWTMALDEMVHEPYTDDDPGEPRKYYALARLKDGGYAMTRPTPHLMMVSHANKHAPKSKNGQLTGPWRDHFEPMAWKTEIHRLQKLLPKSTEMAIALAVDDGLRVDLSPHADPAEVTSYPVIDGTVVAEEPEDAADWPEAVKPGEGQ